MTGHSLIEAIEAQNKLNEITKKLEEEKNKAIAEADARANAEIAKIKAEADARANEEIAKIKAEAAEIERQAQEGLRMAVENRELHRELDRMRCQITDLKSIISKIACLATETSDKLEEKDIKDLDETSYKSEEAVRPFEIVENEKPQKVATETSARRCKCKASKRDRRY